MSSKSLLSWFEKRRRSQTLALAQQQILLAIETVKELELTLIAFSKSKSKEVKSSIKRLFGEEIEIDNLRRVVLAELSKGEIPLKYREDLSGLVRRLDRLADHIKDSARSISLLIDVSLPQDIMNELVAMSNELRASATTLGDCIETLGTDPSKSIRLAQKVDVYEGVIDEKHLSLKSLLMKYSKRFDTAALIFLKDLVEYMEMASDVCVNTADYLRTLASSAS